MSTRRFPAWRLLLIPFLLLAGFYLWFSTASAPMQKGSTRRVTFTIAQGQTLDSVGRSLLEQKLIRSLPAFKLQVTLSNLAKKIQAGDFSLTPGMDLPTLTQALTHATTDRWVTFLEGWRREEFAQALVDSLSPNNPDYAFNPTLFVTLTATIEGKLFPDTYSFTKSTTAKQAADRLTSTFAKKTASLENHSGLSSSQALVLASLIERESRVSGERPTVAGVLLKRLEKGWPLQVDATVQYLKTSRSCSLLTCDWWPDNITRDDLAVKSPFNTYAQTGLPPAPISNPSLDSISAAYNPKTSDYWFYLHDPDGRIHFAKTIEQHNANVSKYLGK